MSETIRVFVGTDWRAEKSDLVLKYSAEKHCSLPIEWTWMRAKDPGWSGWAGQAELPHPPNGWATPFTMFRYAVPEMCGFKGRAIYLDTDMVVFGDLAELWRHKNRKPWYCTNDKRTDVSVIDCAPFRVALEQGRWPPLARIKTNAYPHRVRAFLLTGGLMEMGLPTCWNSLDRYVPGETKLLHFTKMSTQPWKPWPERFAYERPKDVKAESVWWEMYDEASKAVAQ